MMMNGTGMIAWGVFSFLLNLLLILVFVVIMVAVVKWLLRQNTSFFGDKETALDILKKRYARGEINNEEFERLRKDIE